MQRQRDSKNNIVDVTLFESNLAKLIIEKNCFYKDLYIRILDALDHFFKQNRSTQKTACMCLVSIFHDIHTCYGSPSHHLKTFDDLKQNFNLLAIDTFIKQFCDSFLKFKKNDIVFASQPIISTVVPSLFELARHALFVNPEKAGTALNGYLRSHQLFSIKNRGVKESDSNKKSMSLGIVDEQYTPDYLRNYFVQANECAGFTYVPDENAYVAQWLMKRQLPVISGTSGSTEQMFSRVLPLINCSQQEIKMLLLTQTCAMIALGHHSFFECFLVADRWGYKLETKETLLEFYLQCIPHTIQADASFKAFLASEKGGTLIKNLPLYETSNAERSDATKPYIV